MIRCSKLFCPWKGPPSQGEDDTTHGIRVHPDQLEGFRLASDEEGQTPLSTYGLSNTENAVINEGSSFHCQRVMQEGNRNGGAFHEAHAKEQAVSSQMREDTEDLKPTANKNQQVNTKSNDTSKLIEENRRLREQVTSLSSVLGLELSSKETSLENVTSKSRPSLTATKYVELHSNEWLLAKEALDGHQTEDNAWCVKLLCRTIQIGVNTAKEVLKTSELHLCTLLKTISARGICSPHEAEVLTSENVDKMPPSLSHEINQYIRSNSEAFDASVITERICTELTSEFPDNFPEVKEEEAVQTFIKACAEVAWQIVIQQPPMYISCSPTKFDKECHERWWDCSDMTRDQSLDIEYVWPILYESEKKDRVLTRGIVRMTPRPINAKAQSEVYF